MSVPRQHRLSDLPVEGREDLAHDGPLLGGQPLMGHHQLAQLFDADLVAGGGGIGTQWHHAVRRLWRAPR